MTSVTVLCAALNPAVLDYFAEMLQKLDCFLRGSALSSV